MACDVLPVMFRMPLPFSSRCPLTYRQPFCEPPAPSTSVFSVSFFTLISMRLPLVILIGAPVGLVNVRPFNVTVAL